MASPSPLGWERIVRSRRVDSAAFQSRRAPSTASRSRPAIGSSGRRVEGERVRPGGEPAILDPLETGQGIGEVGEAGAVARDGLVPETDPAGLLVDRLPYRDAVGGPIRGEGREARPGPPPPRPVVGRDGRGGLVDGGAQRLGHRPGRRRAAVELQQAGSPGEVDLRHLETRAGRGGIEHPPAERGAAILEGPRIVDPKQALALVDLDVEAIGRGLGGVRLEWSGGPNRTESAFGHVTSPR